MAQCLRLVVKMTTSSSSPYVILLFAVLWQLGGVRGCRPASAVGCVSAAHHSARVLGPTQP